MNRLGAQVIWNGMPFGAITGTNTFLPVQDFSLSTRVKTETDEETGMMKVTGHEPQECCIAIRVQKLAGADPRATFAMLDALKGLSGGVYLARGVSSTLAFAALDALQTSDWRKLLSADNALNLAKSLLLGANVGGCPFMLTSVAMEAQGITAGGDIYDALLTLSLTEDADQRLTGGLRVYYNRKDITESIQVTGCLYDMHAEGEPDSLRLAFADTKKQWADWKPSAQGDTVRITDGALDSGELYIDALKPTDGRYTLHAYSVPKSAYAVKSRSFDGLTLPRLASKIASDNKLKLKLYDVPETPMKYSQQRGKSDLAFLQEACQRAGVSFLVYNGTLCLYGERSIERREASKTLTLSVSDKFTVTDDRHASYSSCELRNGTYTGTASDSAVATGKAYREAVQAAWAGQADANAAAQAKLRQLNKRGKRAELEMRTQRQLAAGSVVTLLCKGWAGKAFVYRLRHDLLNKRSTLWVREPLAY